MRNDRVVLVTGASRGIGRALCLELAGRGRRVYGTARTWPEAEGTLPFEAIEMDVTNDASVSAAVHRLLESEGRIDILVNNAGIGLSGPVEETPLEPAQRLFDTNYFGTVRTIRAVLPAMRRQGSGTVANVASAAGKIGIPFQSHYAASKFAVEGFSEALYHELLPLGIRVLLIEPGDVRTAIWRDSEHVNPANSLYATALARFHAVKAREMGDAAEPPERTARKIADILESGDRGLRHPVAGMAGLFLLARKLAPDSLFLWAVRRNYR